MLAAGTVLGAPSIDFGLKRKLKIVLIGTGIRGTSFWGQRIVDTYSDIRSLLAYVMSIQAGLNMQRNIWEFPVTSIVILKK